MTSNLSNVHSTSIVEQGAHIAASATIGPFCIIGANVSIGDNTVVQSHTVISGKTTIGNNNTIYPFCSIGAAPQDLKYNNEDTALVIGDFNIIRESCTIHRGTVQDNGVTQIGNHNLLMVNTHIAHDCIVGNHNIIGNNAGIAGHVVIGDKVLIGGNCGIHQFCKVGSYSMMAGGSILYKDIPAFVLAAGNPAKASGMNYEGMRRLGWTSQKITVFKQAYQLVYKKGLTLQNALIALKEELLSTEADLLPLITSLEQSQRGIIR